MLVGRMDTIEALRIGSDEGQMKEDHVRKLRLSSFLEKRNANWKSEE